MSVPYIIIFSIAGRLFILRVPPVVPAGIGNVAAQLTIQEKGGCIGPPGTAQVYFADLLRGSEPATVEHVSIRHIGRRRGGCDVGIGLAVQFAVLEPGGGGSENEIGGPFDVALPEV